MDDKSMHSQVVLLKEMVVYCQEIRELLNHDQAHFTINDLDALEASNRKKTEYIHQLERLAQALNKDYLANMREQPDIQIVINKLKSEITLCYEYIVTNNTIVFSNMKQLKDIWDKLLKQKSSECVYDRRGSTRRS